MLFCGSVALKLKFCDAGACYIIKIYTVCRTLPLIKHFGATTAKRSRHSGNNPLALPLKTVWLPVMQPPLSGAIAVLLVMFLIAFDPFA